MKLLLTSGGVTNASIRAALVEMLGRPIEECHALCIPTAQWGHPMCGPNSVRRFVTDTAGAETMTGLGWASVGLLELTALPSIGIERWEPWVRAATCSPRTRSTTPGAGPTRSTVRRMSSTTRPRSESSMAPRT